MASSVIDIVGPREIAVATPWPALIEALTAAFRSSVEEPLRQVSDVVNDELGRRRLMIMPAWSGEADIGVKLLTISEGQRKSGPAAIAGLYVYFDAESGKPVAIFDAEELTARRTAAVSAIATDLLAPVDARSLLIVGTGRLATSFAEAMCAVRKIERIHIWGRNADRAATLAVALDSMLSANVSATNDLAAAAGEADILCTLTPSERPLLMGAWIKRQAHVNLVGAYRADMRESDGALLRRAERIFVDNPAASLIEAGDIVQAMAEGCVKLEQVSALFDLIAKPCAARTGYGGLTLFKSVGSASQDLAAARLCWKRRLVERDR